MGIYKTVMKAKHFFEYISHLKMKNLASMSWTNTKMDNSGNNRNMIKYTTAWWFPSFV